MRDFIIATDTTSDLPKDFLENYNIPELNLYYAFGDEVYGKDKKLSDKDFYNRMRNGELPTTMAITPEEAIDTFTKYAKDGKDILYIAFSSALSSTYNNACIAANEVMEAYPETKIIVVDSLSASLGEGLMVYRACQLRNEGRSIDEVAEYLNEHATNFVHLFTVDDLHHLHRGGRVSKATAVIGTLASIKPILHVDDNGKLVSLSKTRGRKKSISELFDLMKKLIGKYEYETDKVFISHGDCLEEAEFLADMIRQEYPHFEIMINYVSPTIGAHAGPGVIALFFMGDSRK